MNYNQLALPLLIVSIMMVAAVFALFLAIKTGQDVMNERNAFEKRVDELDKELKFQIKIKKTFQAGLEAIQKKKL